ncbi:ComEC/Rec2 family competence protein [Polaribacter dokdonensis]|uniref:Competence protein ComEC n=2 Tax=Polaribacter TaxID=52959 RepID=A0A1H5EVL5_9FLAO|nr:ComEC/Rec2 family competence protein [Polaribacter dokdonensis]SED95155.1 competence protein ComEC [Polaribacter dokdonensis DSW-5]
MKKVLAYLPLHFAMLVILGILCQFYFKVWQFGFLKIGLLFLTLLLFLLIKHRVLNTLISFFLFYFIGVSSVYINNDLNYDNHYSNHIEAHQLTFLKISKVLKPNRYYKKFEAEVIQVDSTKTRGKILLNISNSDYTKILNVDAVLVSKLEIQSISKSLNPYQFNYKTYLEKQRIQEQIYLKEQDYLIHQSSQNTLIGYSDRFRNKVEKALKKYNFKANDLAVINALLLGKRVNISKDLLEDYANAGAIHILAVSGLHVGIILLILSFLLKPLEQIRNGKIIKTVLIVIFLWVFAFIAGLSASVIRAVTMFTFLAIGLFFNRKNIVLFSLISSLFFLLVFKPLFLFDVGFQMSYLAVFGIVILQPKIYKLWKPRYMIIDKFWQLTTVSLAAQVGVLPLSLYYFHQFPGLFILSNLIIVPVLGFILIGGILIITLALSNSLPQVLAKFYGKIISLMNNFVSWIAKQEDFLFTEISLSLSMMFIIYLVIIFWIYFFLNRKPRRLIYLLISIIVLQGFVLYEEHQKRNKDEFIVFHKSRNTIIGERRGASLSIHHDLDSTFINQLNAITAYQVNQNVKVNTVENIPYIFTFRNQNVLVVDSLGVYRIGDFKNQIILLKQSPKINLERLIKELSPKQIIADGSNYKSYVKRWKATSEKLNIPFYDTSINGAFILKN